MDRLSELESYVRRLARKVDDSLENLDEQNFSNEYINRQHALDEGLSRLGASLDSVKNARITEARIDNASIGSAKLKRACVDTIHIKHSAIHSAHIADSSITNAHIENGAITNAKIGNMAVDSANIQDGAITTAHIADASISNAKIATMAVDTANIALGAIKQALIANGAVGSAQIADASITDAKIVELTANKITAGVLEVARLIITGENSIVEAINNQNATSEQSKSTIDGKSITKRSITADNIVAHSITGNEIAARSINANNILANAITGAEIKGDSIEARHIKSGEISTEKLASNVGERLDITSNMAIISKVDSAKLGKMLGSIIEQAKGYIKQEITVLADNVKANSDALESYQKNVRVWQRFSKKGLELGRSDSPFSLRLTEEKLSFLLNDIEIAYFANNRLYIISANIGDILSIGDSEDGFFDIKVKNRAFAMTLRE